MSADVDGGPAAAVDDGLEAALARTEERVDAALKATAALTRELKRAQQSAARGQLRDLRRALSAATELAERSSQAAESAATSFDLDEEEHLASGAYAKELLETAAAQGVDMYEADDRLACYPSLIRVVPGDAAVEIDRRRERRLRPSVLVGLLAATQARPPRFRPEPFLESLAAGYDLVRSRDQQREGSVVRLVDLWSVLTLLPGQSREYTRPEFARDLYLLDSTGVDTVKPGRRLRWHASSGTRGAGTLTTVAKTGQQQLYWGISFRGRLVTHPAGSEVGVRGGASMGCEAYATFLGQEYLDWYLPAGGGSVKVAVTGDAEVADRFERSLREVAEQQHCVMVSLSAETTKVHLVDQLFFAVARHVDWGRVAGAIVQNAYDAISVPATPGRLTVAEVAADHELNPPELYRSVRRELEHTLLTDSSLPRELRRALLRLAHTQLGSGEVNAAEAGVVTSWLTGEPVVLRELREALIYSRIGRHNARSMLTSVGRLLLRAGYGGLVLHLDLTRLVEARRPPLAERSGVYYSTAAVLDAYELLRQLIDATDELSGALVVAVVPPELLNDEKRGLPSYAALQLRVSDEVRDRRRTNPFASMVRLDVRLEAVP